MHTTPSHVALDTTGTLNTRSYLLAERTLSSSTAVSSDTYVSSSSALNRIFRPYVLSQVVGPGKRPFHFRY